MVATDPTYPAYPIACSLAAMTLLLVLLTSFARQSWNLGVTFLCIWFCLDNLIIAVNAIEWSDNVNIKLYVWCDITSRISIAITVGANMAPLLITRRLYLIANLRSVNPPNKMMRRWDQAVEWTLGLVWPLVSAGPLYYAIEDTRFQVTESLGCGNALDGSIFVLVLTQIWTLLPPLISVLFYYPKVALIFYRHSKDVNLFLSSNNSVSRTKYLRILAIASIDIIMSLPLDILSFASTLRSWDDLGSSPFYSGWKVIHSHWAPETFKDAGVRSEGIYHVFNLKWTIWITPVTAFAIFGLFGLTAEARESYRRIIHAVGSCFGWKLSPRECDTDLGSIEFAARSIEIISLDSGTRTPIFVTFEPLQAEQGAQHSLDSGEPSEPSSDVGKLEEPSRDPRSAGETRDRQVHDAETASTDVAAQPVKIAGSAV